MMGFCHTFSLVGEEVVNLCDGTVESDNVETMVGSVKDQILTHNGQTDQSEISAVIQSVWGHGIFLSSCVVAENSHGCRGDGGVISSFLLRGGMTTWRGKHSLILGWDEVGRECETYVG
jgi:hypothetical protein